LFRQFGFGKTTVADIAAELGMSPANIYKFFSSKEAIIQASCGRNLVVLSEAVQRHMVASGAASFAFVMGVMPVAISNGAGSGGQNAIGTGTIGGMLSATVLAIFFVPLFFVATLRLFRVKPKP
jgi:AcrR family transcriptional regulator